MPGNAKFLLRNNYNRWKFYDYRQNYTWHNYRHHDYSGWRFYNYHYSIHYTISLYVIYYSVCNLHNDYYALRKDPMLNISAKDLVPRLERL